MQRKLDSIDLGVCVCVCVGEIKQMLPALLLERAQSRPADATTKRGEVERFQSALVEITQTHDGVAELTHPVHLSLGVGPQPCAACGSAMLARRLVRHRCAPG